MEHQVVFKTKQEVMQSQSIQIRRGIFQRDSLSPLLFCIALILLNNELKRVDCGYQVNRTEMKISYLFIHSFSIPEIHQNGYRTFHYNNNRHNTE
jgi:hypothetical protein